jgi:shikimate dehydrogenase
MQGAALAALGLDGWRYSLLPVPPDLFAETVRALPAAGFVGANVTVPHKEAALALADRATGAAREIGAANTLTFAPDGAVEAENTDAPGLLDALARPVAGERALVLGAGGSARAAVWALREAGADVAVCNRTAARARALARDLGVRAVERAKPADLLVNCTTVGLHDAAAAPIDLAALAGFGTVVDLVYRAGGTALVNAARAAGLPTVDGLEILVRQGARSLTIWTGLQAPLEAMRLAARDGGAA